MSLYEGVDFPTEWTMHAYRVPNMDAYAVTVMRYMSKQTVQCLTFDADGTERYPMYGTNEESMPTWVLTGLEMHNREYPETMIDEARQAVIQAAIQDHQDQAKRLEHLLVSQG